MIIELTQNKEVEIDDSDYSLVNNYKWYAVKIKNRFYAACRIKEYGRKIIFLHRFLMNVWDKTVFIDHINGNGLNCKRSNLRIVNYKQNNSNKKSKNGKNLII